MIIEHSIPEYYKGYFCKYRETIEPLEKYCVVCEAPLSYNCPYVQRGLDAADGILSLCYYNKGVNYGEDSIL